MASDSSDDIGYVKLLLLLVKGGVFLAKKNVERILNLDGKSIDDVLKSNVADLDKALKKKLINKKQKLVLFPEPTAPTDLERWDISLYSYILLKLFGDKFDSGEKAAIEALRETRNELAHTASTTLTEELFLRQWERLKMVLCQLQRHLTQADQDEYNRIAHQISKVTDFHVAANELKPFAGSDEVVDEAITKTLKSLEQSMADCCNLVDTLPDTERKKDITTFLYIGTMVEAMARIFVDAPTQEVKIKAAIKLLESLQQGVSHVHDPTDEQSGLDEHDPTDEQSGLDEVLAACLNFVAEIRKRGVDIVKVEKGSILLTFRCPTIAALKNISKYFSNKMYEQSLIEVENALSKYVGSPVKLDMNIVLETLYSALAQIEQDSKDRSVVLTLKCKDSDGVKNAVDIFGNGPTKGALKSLSEALSRYVGEKIELHSTIDDDQLTKEIAIVDDKMQIINSQEDIVETIGKLLEKCRRTTKETLKNAYLSNHSLDSALLEIKKYRQEIIRRIDESVKKEENKVLGLKLQNDKKIKTAGNFCDNLITKIEATYGNVRKLNTSQHPDQLFSELKEANKKLQEYESSIMDIPTQFDMDKYYEFIPEEASINKVMNEKGIGHISIQRQRSQGTFSTSDFQPHIPTDETKSTVEHAPATDIITPTCIYTIPINEHLRLMGFHDRFLEYELMRNSRGMAVLPPDRLVLIDEFNRSIKLVDVNSKTIISQLSIKARRKDQPWDITTTTNTEVAITIPSMQCIQFISVGNPSKSLPDQLTMTRTIKTHGTCSCLCYHQDKLVVTYADTGGFEIMDMAGTVITQMRIDTVDSRPSIPAFVQANSESIFVSGRWNYVITIFNWQGKITGRITDINNPERLALLYDNSLLVCQSGHYALYHVSGSTTKRVHLQNEHHTNTICVDNKGHRLYIHDGFNIQVYKT